MLFTIYNLSKKSQDGGNAMVKVELCAAIRYQDRSAGFRPLSRGNVNSFSQTCEWLVGYVNFLRLFRVDAEVGKLVSIDESDGVEMYFGWIKGVEGYLCK